MKNKEKHKQRLRKNQFYYLPYPTFLIQIKSNYNYYNKCFLCHKIFKTKYRLSLYLVRTKRKCVKNRFPLLKLDSSDNMAAKNIHKNFIINDSSLKELEMEFSKEKRNFIYFISYMNQSSSIKPEIAFNIFNDKCLKRKNIFFEFLIKKDNIIW